jgi:hypothetical protein
LKAGIKLYIDKGVCIGKYFPRGGIMKSGKRKKRKSKGKRQKMKEKLKAKGKKTQRGKIEGKKVRGKFWRITVGGKD